MKLGSFGEETMEAQCFPAQCDSSFYSDDVELPKGVGRGAVDVNQSGAVASGGGISLSLQPQAEFGFCLLANLRGRPMEDFHVAEFHHVEGREVGMFGVFDSHGGGKAGAALQQLLFRNIVAQGGVWADPAGATRDGYLLTDRQILDTQPELLGGSSAVTAMLLDGGARLIVANLGDSRAVLCKTNGEAVQLTVDHVPSEPVEKASVEMRGGVVSTFPGDLARVDGQLALARCFGDRQLKEHLGSKPDVSDTTVDATCEFVVIGSNGLWASVANQESVDLARQTLGRGSAEMAASQLAVLAQDRASNDDISCLVIRFREL